jgi:energy-coupling factor transporter ATP-binding protein EcfA2
LCFEVELQGIEMGVWLALDDCESNCPNHRRQNMREYLYLWIKEWVPVGKDDDGAERYLFENIGIPLSSKYSVDFDRDSPIISITRNRHYNVNYFSKTISDLVAVVGENGAGKSSLLELLKQISVKGYGDSSAISYQLIYIDYENNKDNLTVILKDGETMSEKHCKWHIKKDGPSITVHRDSLVDVDMDNSSGHKRDFVIFYAPFFDNEVSSDSFDLFDPSAQWVGLSDISTNKLINVYSYKLHNSSEHRKYFDRLDSYSYYEQLVELEFLADFLEYKDNLPMDLPKHMYILNNDYPVNFVMEKLNEENPKKEIVNKINLLNFINNWKKEIMDKQQKEENALKDKIYLSVFACLYKSDTELNRYLFYNITKDTTSDDMINKLNKYTDGRLENLIRLLDNDNTEKDNNKYFFDIKEKKDALRRIMKEHYEIKKNYLLLIPFLLFKRQKLSTGENNIIQLFARFYNIWRDFPNQYGCIWDADDILFLIDEAEANFHPEWQRQYIKMLICWIELIMKKLGRDKTPMFQIILSTHSPFVACDLPNGNMVRLRCKGRDGAKSAYIPKTGSKNIGIGAYVVDLLKGDFFVKSLLGEFAEDNINALIKEMRKKRKLSAKSQFIFDELGDKFLKLLWGNLK